MSEGRCYLSSYLTGESPNTVGACSPARFVRWQQTPQGLESRLNEVLIASVKIEGRQRSPAYVSQVAKVWRQAIDRCKADPQNFVPQSAWMETLGSMSEGTQTTLGAYHRKWQ